VRTYRELFAVAEFRALFASQLIAGCSMTMQSLALSVLVYSQTGSPFLAAAAYLGGYLPQAVGVVAFSSAADRLPPRALLVAADVTRAASYALLATGVLPVGLMLAVVLATGPVYGAVGGVRYLVLADMLPADGFILGRSALTIAAGGTQIAGFAFGGSMLAAFGPRPAMWIATGLAAAAALADRCGLAPRPGRGAGRASVPASWQGIGVLLADRRLRRLLACQWVPNGLIVGVEALYVPYAGQRAVVLFVASAAGMLAGDFALGRFVPATARPRLSLPLYLLLAGPYLGFAGHPGLPVAAVLVGVASLGYGGTLGLQQLFAEAVPPSGQGQAFSLAVAGQLSSQGAAASGSGALAEAVPTGVAMAITAGISILSSVVLLNKEETHGSYPFRLEHLDLRRARRRPRGRRPPGRGTRL
jgi:MFS family permease